MDHFYGIYGVGAVLILIFYKHFQKSNLKLFITGFLIGSITEYSLSFLTEVLLRTQWWNYESYVLNINGRICLLYSLFWAILTIFLVKKVNPIIDKLMKKITKKISRKVLKSLLILISIFLIIDGVATCFAQQFFILRMVKQNNIAVEQKEKMLEYYDKIYGNKTIEKWIMTFWGDEKMIRTFPNMKIEDENKNVIYLDSLLPEIQPYYYKVFQK